MLSSHGRPRAHLPSREALRLLHIFHNMIKWFVLCDVNPLDGFLVEFPIGFHARICGSVDVHNVILAYDRN